MTALTPVSKGLIKIQYHNDSFLPQTIEIPASKIRNCVEGCFGAEEWRTYFGVDVGKEPKLPAKFYDWWFGKDPLDLKKHVYETHLPPVLRPQFITNIQTQKIEPYHLETLENLIKNTQFKGHPSRFFELEIPSEERSSEPKPPCWLVMRRGVLARNKPQKTQIEEIRKLNEKTDSNYEEAPSATDLVTAIFARYRFTGECHLGDSQGMEKRWTFSNCKTAEGSYGSRFFLGEWVEETGRFPVVGGFSPGTEFPSGLSVQNSRRHLESHEAIGMAALRKF